MGNNFTCRACEKTLNAVIIVQFLCFPFNSRIIHRAPRLINLSREKKWTKNTEQTAIQNADRNAFWKSISKEYEFKCSAVSSKEISIMIHVWGFNEDKPSPVCVYCTGEMRLVKIYLVAFCLISPFAFRCPLSTQRMKALNDLPTLEERRTRGRRTVYRQECIPLIFLHSLSNRGRSARSPTARSKKPISRSSHHVYSPKNVAIN